MATTAPAPAPAPSKPSSHSPPTSAPSATSHLHTHLLRLQSSLDETTSLISNLRTIVAPPAPPTTTPTPTIADIDASRIELSADIRARLHDLDEEFAGWKVRCGVLRDLQSHSSTVARGSGGVNVNPLGMVAKGWVSGGGGGGGGARRREERGEEGEGEEVKELERMDVLVGLIGEDLKSARISFRKAEITAKRAIDALRRQQRRSLLSRFDSSLPSPTSPLTPTPTTPSIQRTTTTSSTTTAQPPISRSKSLRPSDILSSTSHDITSSLRRTHALLTSSISTSHFAQQTLAQSTAALEALSGTYADLDGLLKSTVGVLGMLIRSQKSDTWYLMTSFRILLCTIVWLVLRRWLWVVVWAVWYLLKMLVYGGKGGVGVGVWFWGWVGGKGEGIGIGDGVDFDMIANHSEKVEVQGMHSSSILSGEGKRDGHADTMAYIDKIATEMHSGAGVQPEESHLPGEAIPVDDVPGDPALNKDAQDRGNGKDKDKDEDKDETTLPPPEADAHVQRNPKKRVLEEAEQVQGEYVGGSRDEL